MYALNNESYKTESFSLTWGDNLPAGVAFFDDAFGEYRLKIDLFTGTRFCLKCTSSDPNDVRYQLDVVHKDRDGNFKFRTPVGDGFYHKNKIVIEVYAFEKPLILELNPGGELEF